METNVNTTRLHVTADIQIDQPQETSTQPVPENDTVRITGRVTHARK